MRRIASLFLLAAAASLFCDALPAAAGDSGEKTISRFCAAYGDLGLSHGGCVAYFTNGNIVPHDTSVCRNSTMQELLGTRSAGQCVKALKDHKKAD